MRRVVICDIDPELSLRGWVTIWTYVDSSQTGSFCDSYMAPTVVLHENGLDNPEKILAFKGCIKCVGMNQATPPLLCPLDGPLL